MTSLSEVIGHGPMGHCQLAEAVWRYGHSWVRAGRSAWPGSGRCGGAGDLVPGGESAGHVASVFLGAESVAARSEVWDIPLNAARNRWVFPGEVNRFMARSRARVGWWEFSARLFRYFDRRCSTPGISRRCATG
jgi:hypothetical protein